MLRLRALQRESLGWQFKEAFIENQQDYGTRSALFCEFLRCYCLGII